MLKKISFTVATLALAATFNVANAAANAANCKEVPTFTQLQTALKNARAEKNGGFNLDMWGTIVNRAGEVCAVAKTGAETGDQWPGSRVISAQKANTANSFSLPGLALSTANLYSAVQPGGSLFGLQESNPVDITVAYTGDTTKFGTAKDPLNGKRIGGVNVFGGGLALYNTAGKLVGAIGVSGDSSCADHNIAWRTRHLLAMDKVSAGVAGDQKDNIIFDITAGKSTAGFGHPTCGVSDEVAANKLVLTDAPLPTTK